MDGSVTNSAIDEQNYLSQALDIQVLQETPDNLDQLSFADSFLDFDSIKEFFENIPSNSDRNCSENIEFGVAGKSLMMSEEGKNNSVESALVVDGSGCEVKESDSSCCIAEEMGKVSLVGLKSETVNGEDVSEKVGLVGETDIITTVDDIGVKTEMVIGEDVLGEVSLVGQMSETVNDEDVCEKNGLVGETDTFTVDGTGVKSEMVVDEYVQEKVGVVGSTDSVSVDGSGAKSEMANDEDVTDKVGLVGGTDPVTVDGSGVKTEMVIGEDMNGGVGLVGVMGSGKISESSSESISDEEKQGSSSSSSSSSDEEEEEEKEKKVKMEAEGACDVGGELEEGEIEGVDVEEPAGTSDDDDEEESEGEMVAGSDAEFDFIGDEDGDGVGASAVGPIKSKNELQVLPPVPRVETTLQPEHKMLPVGAVLSVLGAQVIVEGVEKHNPLNEGSILWITESRSPLGLIDEIFGPVKNPYYVVRYNSDSEVPAGIQVGTSISFVQEFANHVLNDNNLYKKGYDMSGENDEELSEELEFSDDEKEAEYRRKQKMEKRGMSDQKPNRKMNKKKIRNREGAFHNNSLSVHQNQFQNQISSPASESGNPSPCSPAGQGFIGGTDLVPQLQQMAQMAGYGPSFNGVWTDGMPYQQTQNVFPGGFQSSGGMPWIPQNNQQQHPNQIPMMNNMPFMQQFDPTQMALPNVGLASGQPNFFPGHTFAPWLGLMGQNGLNPMMGMGIPGQPPLNAGQPQMSGMGFPGQPGAQATNAGESFKSPRGPSQFNMGASSRGGRKPYRRGGGDGGGRGRGYSR